MRAIVVGGGIGGLSAANALRRAGIEAAVFERAPGPPEVGVGVGLWSNAPRVLKDLGLYEAVRGIGAEIGGETRSWSGGRLFGYSAGEMRRRYKEASVVVHRADLQGVLLAALPEGSVRYGARLVGFSEDGEEVVARFADGREETGDLLVGADGLRSATREALVGDGPPLYAGLTAWRGVAEGADCFAPEGEGLNLWGRGSEFGVMNIGGGRAYWFLTKNAPEGEPESPAGRKSKILDRLPGRFPAAKAAVEATKILRTDIYDREPIERWGAGRATLLGDAAHPMTPHLGQGACQAIEDAAVLAGCLGGTKRVARSVAVALRLYEERRRVRTTELVRSSRRVGHVLQLENPLLCGLRDALVEALPSGAMFRQLDPVLGYTV